MWSVVKDLRVVLILAAAMSSVVMAYSGGDGSVGNPYQIDNKADLLELGATPEDYGKCFILTSDIDLAGETFTEAVIAPDMDNYELGFQGFVFTGSFNGDGHIIKNLTIKATDKDYVGLIGYQDRGKVYKLGVENIDITGRGSVGGLVGYNSGTIIACYATDAVTGYTSVGGLVGENAGLITACYATGAVTGDANGGGLVGWHSSGTITACYATGSVSESSEAAGGLVGYRESGIITACFWDIQSSGQAGGSGGKGLTTEQMKTLSIFQNAGWADQGWVINNGEDYPRLSWENTEGVPIPLPQDNPFIGSGTANDPYLIFTPQEFILLNKYSGVLNKYIKLMENLDLNGFTMYPIGDLGSFSGVFDGNGHTISNVIIHLPSNDYVGLFSYVGPCGKIQNLGIENLTITGRDYVGGLVGYADYSDIENCYITGAVNGDEFFIGGIVGYNRFSTILASHAAVSVSGSSISDYVGGLIGCNDSGVIGYSYAVSVVTGDAFVGGLVGIQDSGTIRYCYASGIVTGGDLVGGLVGCNFSGVITDSYATGTVSGQNVITIGGLVGLSSGTITASYATNEVIGDYFVGGLVGENSGIIMGCYTTSSSVCIGSSWRVGGLVGGNSGTITDSFANGSVNGGHCVGGLVGGNRSGTITACYTIAKVIGKRSVGGLVGENESIIKSCYASGVVTGYNVIGGLVGTNYSGTITACFWDIQTSGLTNSSGGIGKTTAEMQMVSTFTDAGWDFSDNDGDGADWWMPNHDYPRLSWEHPLLGTADNPYQIWTAEQLDNIGNNPNDWDKHFKLIADINMSAYSDAVYHIIGNSTTKFTGTFDGNGHVIRNLSYSTGVTTDCIGLFGRVENAVIKNLILDNVYFSSGSGNVGGLVGWNDSGTLSRCVVRGGIQGTGHVGGLVGRNNGGELTGCRVEAWVNGTSIIGGLVGGNYSGSIENCYAVAAVNGVGNYIGGLTGFNSKGTLLECYAAGEFGDTGAYVGGVAGWNTTGSTVDACFWDMQVSGKSLGIGGGLASGITGKTTEEMQMVSTFTDAGWDFDGEAANGTVDIWRLCGDGVGYPQLSWESGRRGDFACPDGVGVEDLEALGMVWLTAEGQAGYSVACDANGDGRIDMADFEVLAEGWMGN